MTDAAATRRSASKLLCRDRLASLLAALTG
jgi:hypothetical protein